LVRNIKYYKHKSTPFITKHYKKKNFMQKKNWVKYKKPTLNKSYFNPRFMNYWRPYLAHLNKPETKYFLGLSKQTGKLTCNKKVNPLCYLKWLTKMSTWDRITYNSTRLLDYSKFVPVFFFKKRYPWKRRNLTNQIRYNKGKFPASEILYDLAQKRKFPWWKVHFIKKWERNRNNWTWNIPHSVFYENIIQEKRSNYVLKSKNYLQYCNIRKKKSNHIQNKNNKKNKISKKKKKKRKKKKKKK